MIAALEGVTFGYDEKTVLNNISLTVSEGEKIGLIGANGTGKSTLLALLTGELQPDEGEVFRKKDLSVGCLKQTEAVSSSRTVMEEMRSVLQPVFDCEQRMHTLRDRLASLTVDTVEYRACLREIDKEQAFFDANEGYQAEVKIKTVLNGMGFAGRFDDCIAKMSGGEKTRLAVCKLLLSPFELLILDEPTNHLDFASLGWLEGYLQSVKGAVIIVSHDRYFLDKTVTSVWEIEAHKLQTFRGNYSKYKVLKAERRERQRKEYEKQQLEIEQKLDYVQRNIVRASTSKMAKSRLKQIEAMDIVERPVPPPEPPVFRFQHESESLKEVFRLKEHTVKVPGKTLVEGLTLTVRRGERLAIVGANGTGKSTLLKEALACFGGLGKETTIGWGGQVQLSYYDQENNNLNFEHTVLEELWNRHSLWVQHQARGLLAQVGLSAEDVSKKVGVLSGGERAKLGLAVVIAEKRNTLLLDEPTNHLDLESKESLEAGLKEYGGTVIFVSHDRYLLNAVATHVLELDGGKGRLYTGNYDAMLAAKKKEAEAVSVAEPVAPQPKATGGGYRTAKQRAEEVRRKNRLKEVEALIAEKEEAQAMLQERMSLPETVSDYKKLQEINDAVVQIVGELEALYAEWEELML